MVRRAMEFCKRQKRRVLQIRCSHLSGSIRIGLRLIWGTIGLIMPRLRDLMPVAGFGQFNGISVRPLMLTCTIFLSAVIIPSLGTQLHAQESPPSAPPSAPPPQRPSVLILDQEVLTRPAIMEFMEGFRAEFLTPGSSIAPEIFVETMDLSRLASPNTDISKAADWLLDKYQGRRLDFLIATSEKSLRFLISKREKLAPDAWIIAIERFGDQFKLGGETPRFLKLGNSEPSTNSLELALQLFPATRRVAYVATTFPHQASTRASESRMRSDVLAKGLEFVSLLDLSLREFETRLKQLPRDTVVFYSGIYVDSNGQRTVPAEVVERLCHVSQHPIFSGIDTYLGRGVVGGMCVEVRSIGRRVASMLRECIEGNSALEYVIPEVALLDARALRRFGVPDSRISPGSEIRFQELGFWELYGRQTLVGLLVLIFQAGLIVALVVQLRRRRSAEQTIRIQTEKLEQASRLSTLGQYAASLAHELGQPLGAILNNVEAAAHLLKNDPQSHLEELREIIHDIAADDRRAGLVLDGIRQMVRRQQLTMRPMDLQTMLRNAMLLAKPRLDVERIAVNVACELQRPMISGDEILLQQAVLNLVNNSVDAIIAFATKTASGNFLEAKAGSNGKERLLRGTIQFVIRGAVPLDRQDSEMRIELVIVDNGGGIESSEVNSVLEPFFTTRSAGLGIGLSVVQSIMDQHEGRMTLQNRSGTGLTVILSFPALIQSPGMAEGAAV
ncbi:MAG: ATP-binding protein [Planctomycetia bacterium]